MLKYALATVAIASLGETKANYSSKIASKLAESASDSKKPKALLHAQ